MSREQRKEQKRELDAQIAAVGIVNVIRSIHLERMFMMEQRKRCELALGSYLRQQEGWRKELPDAQRKEIAARVIKMMATGEDLGRHQNIVLSSRAGSAVFSEQEDLLTWKLEYAAVQLPVWENFAKGVRGFGARSLGVIIGEAGDLSNYPDHSRLWKRMGITVIDGVRQGGLFKTASAEDWMRHGYDRRRRAHMFVIGECLLKAGGEYHEIYLARKEFERARALEQGLQILPAAKIPKADRENYMSEGHIHKRAQRYAEKKLLRRLWQAWRRDSLDVPVKVKRDIPAADFAAVAA